MALDCYCRLATYLRSRHNASEDTSSTYENRNGCRICSTTNSSDTILSSILSLWQNYVCTHWWTLISCDLMLCALWVCLKALFLGHYFFCIYTSPLATIAQVYNVFQQQYADDTQLYVTLSSINYCDSITTLQLCLSSLHLVLRKRHGA